MADLASADYCSRHYCSSSTTTTTTTEEGSSAAAAKSFRAEPAVAPSVSGGVDPSTAVAGSTINTAAAAEIVHHPQMLQLHIRAATLPQPIAIIANTTIATTTPGPTPAAAKCNHPRHTPPLPIHHAHMTNVYADAAPPMVIVGRNPPLTGVSATQKNSSISCRATDFLPLTTSTVNCGNGSNSRSSSSSTQFSNTAPNSQLDHHHHHHVQGQPISLAVAAATQQRQSDSSNSTSSATCTHGSNNKYCHGSADQNTDCNDEEQQLWRLQLPISGSADQQQRQSRCNNDGNRSSTNWNIRSSWTAVAVHDTDREVDEQSRGIITRREYWGAAGEARGGGDEDRELIIDDSVEDNATDDMEQLRDLKAQIMAHPAYPRLLSAYINCRKFGAPPEVAQHLEEVLEKVQLHLLHHHRHNNNSNTNNRNYVSVNDYHYYYYYSNDHCIPQPLQQQQAPLLNNNNNNSDDNYIVQGNRRRHLQQQQHGGYCKRPAVVVVDDQNEELDKFMNAYVDVLQRYQQELSTPFYKAMAFLHSTEAQLSVLLAATPHSNNNYNADSSSSPAANIHNNYSSSSSSSALLHHPLHVNVNAAADVAKVAALKDESEEEAEQEEEEMMRMRMMDEVDSEEVDAIVEDQKLKQKLFQKYRGQIQVLRQQFMRKRKKGKLPKDSRQKLLEWWNQHYKWPYPTEAEKTSLAEASGLDPKQINNWFINQRKRHWKPTEDMKFHVLVPDSESTINMNAPGIDATTNMPAY